MVTTFPVQPFDGRDERQAKIISWITTVGIAVLLFLILMLIKIITPIPAIPPDPEVMSLEIGLITGTGGDAATQGGGSNGNTGTPGMQDPSEANNKPTNPTDNGAVTDANSNNNTSANSNHTSTTEQPKMSAEMLATIANFNKNKGKASIQIGGDGKGDPYTGGLGNGSGIDKGPGEGDPGKDGPGGQNGTSPMGNGNRIRHILSKPEIVNPTQTEGKVVVNVYVNRLGKVVKTEVKEATTMNSTLRATATQSAYKIVFDADPNGPELLLMAIDIYFTLK